MEEFFQACLAFPTVAFSLLLGLVLVYWLFVMVGALCRRRCGPRG
jgi:hypothetical protein